MGTEQTETTTPATNEATTETVEAPVATQVEAAAQEGQKPEATEGKATAETKPETFTKSDVDKLLEQAKATVKGGYEGTTKELKNKYATLEQAHKEVLARLQQEDENRFLRSVEEKGGDVDTAKQVLSLKRDGEERARQLNDLAEKLAAKQSELDMAGKGYKLTTLVTQYGLSKDEAKTLSGVTNPLEMELEAVKMALAKKSATAKPAEKIAGDGAGKSGIDLSKLDPMEALSMALDHKI